MLVYSGGVGDQMSLDANPDTRCTQVTLESRTPAATLHFLHLNPLGGEGEDEGG